MTHKRKMRIGGVLALVLCLLCLMNFTKIFFPPVLVAQAKASKESIAQKEKQIQDAKSQRQALQGSLTDLQNLKKSLEVSENNLNAYIAKLDSSLDSIQAKIDSLNQQIEKKKEQIEETRMELEEAERERDEQYAAMKQRIRFMFEKGDTMPIEALMKAGNFSDFLNKVEFIRLLSSYDRHKLEEFKQEAKLAEVTKEALEEEKKTLDDTIAAQTKEENNLQALISAKNQEVFGISADIHDKEAAIKAYEADIAQQNAEIAALEKMVAAERAQLAAENRKTYDGGMFAWPCPSYTRVSSDYGTRIHPILHIERFHNGIDLAAPGGSPILAAYSGRVVAAAYSSSMGNYVMIDHGSGLYTIYMHASALSVSAGQEVQKGQQIGAVGSTGRSTGNHLHFSVRLNGSYVSPWNYLR